MSLKMLYRTLLGSLGVAAISFTLSAHAEFDAATMPRINHHLPRHLVKPELDGKLNEAVWQKALKIELGYENNPGDGVPAPVKTVAYLYEDGKNLHIGIRAFDPEPEKIRAYLRDRDALWDDDNVGIIIDTFNDQRSGVEFFVNPLGAQADMSMTDTNGWNEDSSWDAIWDSAGQIDEQGFSVEMSIPFSALRFPESSDALTWNIAVWRNWPRDVRHQMANYKPSRDSECNLCLFDQLSGFKDIKVGENLQLTPTLTSGRTDSRENQGDAWESGSVEVDGGLDLRWGITQDMVLNATINPDFSQIEADSAQLDVNNTFSLFFPERRPFFLDGASYFDTARLNLVHTRNIADPDYGAKITGKSAEHSFALLAANDKQTAFLLPGNQGSDIAELTSTQGDAVRDVGSEIAIARYKMDIGERNNIGALVTTRSGSDYSNTVASIDGSYWMSSEDNLNYQLAYSDTDNPLSLQNEDDNDNEVALADKQSDHALSLGYSHRTRDYSVNASYNNIGEDFRADLGFMSQVNYEKLAIGGSQTWYGESGDTLSRWGYFGDWDKTYDADGNMLEEEVELHGTITGPLQLHSNFGMVHRKAFYDGEFFNETFGRFWLGFKPASGIAAEAWGNHGRTIDYANTQLGTSTALGGFLSWQVGQHLQLRGTLEANQMDVDEGRLFIAKQADVRLTYQFNMRSYLRLVVQYTDISRDPLLYIDEEDARYKAVNTQLLYSYKINPQTLFFLGYSDSGYQDDDLSKILTTDRSVFAKFSYAWQM